MQLFYSYLLIQESPDEPSHIESNELANQLSEVELANSSFSAPAVAFSAFQRTQQMFLQVL